MENVVENKKHPETYPPPPAPAPPSSIVAELFGGKETTNPSQTLFNSVFPPAPAIMGKESSPSESSDIFAPSGKREGQNQALDTQNVATDGMLHGDGHTEKDPVYQQEKINPCSFSSSVYYGGQDFYISASSTQNPENYYKENGEDSNDPNAACRGNWWQGSLYY